MLTLKNLKLNIEDQILRKRTWRIFIQNTRATWTGDFREPISFCTWSNFYSEGCEQVPNILVCFLSWHGSLLCRLFCSMICSEPKLDSHRFKDIIDEAIAEGKTLSCRCCSLFSVIIDRFHSVFIEKIMPVNCPVYACLLVYWTCWLKYLSKTICHVLSIPGELKSTKAYEKWAKKISEMEPPTNPLERRVK